jgi:cyclopropane-fatty-acyl-phospholipid synthase
MSLTNYNNLDSNTRRSVSEAPSGTFEWESGGPAFYPESGPKCKFVVSNDSKWRALVARDVYQVGIAFVKSEFDVEGDLVEAIKIYRSRYASHSMPSLKTIAAYLRKRLFRKHSHGSSARDIQFHYDRSNDFYHTFLDSRMVYSCAYFRTPQDTIETAQFAKLQHICKKLQLRVGDRFLDIGCGWGALALEAADQYGTFSTGCTLSSEQRLWAAHQAADREVSHRVDILEQDYRELDGKFDKIASVGMFEHVGHKTLRTYFDKVSALLAEGGYFLNHGIVRPEVVRRDPETLFLANEIFPGGELVRLTDVIRSAEQAGFEVFDIENLRPHYALTCRAWVDRLLKNRAESLKYVDGETYRTWLLYLAASAASFESANTEIHQVLFLKRGQPRPLTRDFLYSQ